MASFFLQLKTMQFCLRVWIHIFGKDSRYFSYFHIIGKSVTNCIMVLRCSFVNTLHNLLTILKRQFWGGWPSVFGDKDHLDDDVRMIAVLFKNWILSANTINLLASALRCVWCIANASTRPVLYYWYFFSIRSTECKTLSPGGPFGKSNQVLLASAAFTC